MIGTDAFFNDGTVAPIAGVVVNKCKPYQETSTGITRKRLLNKTLGTATPLQQRTLQLFRYKFCSVSTKRGG